MGTNVARKGKVKSPKVPHREQGRFTADQPRTFLKHAASDSLYACYPLMLKRAARPSELVVLKRSDIEGNRLIIKQAMKGKGASRVEGATETGDARRPVLDAELRAALDQTTASRRGNGSVWARDTSIGRTSSPGRRARRWISPARRASTFMRLARPSKLPRAVPYNLKSTAVSLLLEARASPGEVQKLCG